MFNSIKGMFSNIWRSLAGIFGIKKKPGKIEHKKALPKKSTKKQKKEEITKNVKTEESTENVYKDDVPKEYVPSEDIYEVDITKDEMAHLADPETSHKKSFSLSTEAMNLIKSMKEKK